MLCFGLQWGEVSLRVSPNPSQVDGVSDHATFSDASKPFHDLHMDPLGGVRMSNEFLVAHLCQAILCFGLQWGGVSLRVSPNPSQVDGVSDHATFSDASKPFHDLHMDSFDVV